MQASAVQPQSVTISSTWPEHCKRWVGQVVESRFHLRQFLGGTDHSAVFLTKPSDRRHEKAAIKFIKSDPRTDDDHLARWQRLRHMQCPGLLEIYEYGRCDIGDTHLLFVVQEFADETLAGVLPERSLTQSEVEQMLPAIVDTLAFLHSKGLAYARLKPTNVMAVGDRLKLSPECPLAFGAKSRWADLGPYAAPELLTGVSAAADVWALGTLVRAALTQSAEHSEKAITAPYNGMVAACTAADPETRASLMQVHQIIASEPHAVVVQPVKRPAQHSDTMAAQSEVAATEATEQPEQFGTRRMLVGGATLLVLVLAIAVGLSLRPKQATSPAPQVIAHVPVATRTPLPAVAASTASAPTLARAAEGVASPASPSGAVLHEALPRVPQTASNTITGTVRVRVRVAVDSEGKVRDAELEQAGPSKYFARLSMDAAHDWRFSPRSSQGMWILSFNYRRTGPSASAAPAS